MTVVFEYWIATVGARHAKLWHCWRAPGAQWLAQEQVALAGSLESGQCESTLRQSSSEKGAHGGRDQGELQFAREAASWLIRTAEADGAENIELIAPEPMLNSLREHWNGRWSDHIHEHQGDLSELPPSKVAQHPVFTLVRGLAARRSN